MEAKKYDPNQASGKYNPDTVQLEPVDLDQEVENWKKKQQDSLVIDFDEAVREERADAIIVRFQGNDYELPKSAPAWLPLYINRHADDDGVVADKYNLEIIESLLGKEFASKIADERNNFVSFDLVNEKILQPVFERWGMGMEAPAEKK